MKLWWDSENTYNSKNKNTDCQNSLDIAKLYGLSDYIRKEKG